jgi:tripartite-type tricarboxylate transporter receptor subunit TctC
MTAANTNKADMRVISGVFVALVTASFSTAAFAQGDWPTKKPISFVVPYAPGGYTDAVGRITARYLEKAFGTKVLVENRAGGGGIVGTQYVAKSPADGYTLCVCSVGAVSVSPVAQKVPYHPLRDLSAISIVSTIPQTVIVKKSLPINSVADLIKYAKEHPGALKYGSSGTGGLMHYSVALFQVRTGTKMTHVPYKGGAPATAAVVSGEVDLSFTNMTDALPQMEADTVRAIAVTSSERSSFAPKLPTIAETVLPNYSVESWNGIMAPAGTPDAIVQRAASALEEMAKDEEVKKAMAVVGASAVSTTPDEYKKKVAQELEQWGELVREFQIK